MIVLFAVVLLVLVKSGHLKNWESFYPTILLMMIGDLTFNFITFKHPFWHYKSAIIQSHTILDLIHVTLSFPCVVILFLGYMPKGLWKRVGYIMLASALYTAIEYVMNIAGQFEYLNGWNTLYSFYFDIGLFSIVMIHYIKPLIAWLCIVVVVPLFLWIAQFPLEIIWGSV
jgi:hypothetical protein